MADSAARGLLVPRLRSWRRDRLLTQAELAEQAGVNKLTIVRAEAGARISFATIHKLAAALAISVQQLLREEPEHVGVL